MIATYNYMSYSYYKILLMLRLHVDFFYLMHLLNSILDFLSCTITE